MCSRSGLLKGRLDKVRQALREVQTDLALDTEDIPDLAYLLAMNYGPDGTSPPSSAPPDSSSPPPQAGPSWAPTPPLPRSTPFTGSQGSESATENNKAKRTSSAMDHGSDGTSPPSSAPPAPSSPRVTSSPPATGFPQAEPSRAPTPLVLGSTPFTGSQKPATAQESESTTKTYNKINMAENTSSPEPQAVSFCCSNRPWTVETSTQNVHLDVILNLITF